MTSLRSRRTRFPLTGGAGQHAARWHSDGGPLQDPLSAGDKKTSGVAAENALNKVFGTKYRIRLDHQILKDHSIFYPQALYNDLLFELSLAPASLVVKGSDPSKLKYKLKKIHLEYEKMRSKSLADDTRSVYSASKEFFYGHVMRDYLPKSH